MNTDKQGADKEKELRDREAKARWVLKALRQDLGGDREYTPKQAMESLEPEYPVESFPDLEAKYGDYVDRLGRCSGVKHETGKAQDKGA